MVPLHNGHNSNCPSSKEQAAKTFVSVADTIAGEAGGRYIVYTINYDRTIGWLDTWNEKGGPQEPLKWKVVERQGPALEKDVVAKPFLRPYAQNADGVPLPNGKHFAATGNGLLSIVQASDLQRVFSDACQGYQVDPADPDKLIYVNSRTRSFYWIDLAKTWATSASVTPVAIPFPGDVADMKLDAAGNFVLCTTEPDGEVGPRLMVLDKVSMRVVAEVPGVGGKISVDEGGTIYFLDEKRLLRLVNSNLASIPKGGFATLEREARKEAARRLAYASQVSLPKLTDTGAGAATGTAEELEVALPKVILDRFSKEIAGADSLDALDTFVRQIEALKSTD